MRKCIDLESQPGFQSIYAPQMQQAIDRGLAGHSGTGVVDWGYNLPIPGTKPTKGGPKPKKTQKDPPKVVVKDPAKLGTGNQFWESLFNNYITQDARKVVNRFPTPIIKGVSGWDGYHQAGAGEWGTVVSSRNHEGRAFIFTHEYWHALDNIIDLATNPDSTGLNMQSSLRLIPSMEKDAKRLGLSFNEKVYYKYLEDNGINFKVDPSGNRTIRIKKGSNRQQAEEQMYPGDHWRIMEQMLRQSKKDLHRANATKEPVKMARAKKLYEDIGVLYDKHIARLETIRKIKKEAAVIHRKLKQTSQPEQGYNHLFSALGDIFDALTDGRVQDWEYANEVWMSEDGVISTFGRHGSGYYNMSRQSDYGKQTSSPRNYNLDSAMRSKRAETWAEWGSMWASHDNTMQAFASKILPSIAKQFDAEMKRALTIKVIADVNKIPNVATETSLDVSNLGIDRLPYYHGTSTPIGDIGYSPGAFNIYGSGLYTTEDKGVAYKYTKKGKGGQPTVYKIEEINPGPSLDLETTPATFGKEMLGQEYADEWFDGKSLREALDEFRGDSKYLGIPAWEVKESMDFIFDKAYRQGYKSVTHEGGKLTGGKRHKVKIFTHPEKDVMLKKISK